MFRGNIFSLVKTFSITQMSSTVCANERDSHISFAFIVSHHDEVCSKPSPPLKQNSNVKVEGYNMCWRLCVAYICLSKDLKIIIQIHSVTIQPHMIAFLPNIFGLHPSAIKIAYSNDFADKTVTSLALCKKSTRKLFPKVHKSRSLTSRSWSFSIVQGRWRQ